MYTVYTHTLFRRGGCNVYLVILLLWQGVDMQYIMHMHRYIYDMATYCPYIMKTNNSVYRLLP